jgi:hypothetical protein
MYRTEINTQKKRTVRQVGHLQELYRNARSTEHKNRETVGGIPASYIRGVPGLTPGQDNSYPY